MKMLNSLIIEGNIKVEVPEEKIGMAELMIENDRGEFEVLIPGEMLTNSVKAHGRKGRGLRIVGYLVQRENKVLICAEHIEFKPYFPKEK